MALSFVKAVDGDDIVTYLDKQLHSHCDRIVTLSIDEVSSGRCHKDTTCVIAVIVTPQMLKNPKDSMNTAIKLVLENATHIIFIYKDCSTNDVRELGERVNSASRDKTKAVEHFEITDANHDQDYDNVVIKLRGMIRATKKDTVSRPSARKFLVDPDTVTESRDSVTTKIILLEEDIRYSNLKVHISDLVAVGGNVTQSRLRDGVWTIKIQGLTPGKHTINVTADGSDLGSANVMCVTCCDALFAALPEVVRTSAGRLLGDLLKLDPYQLDDELIDFTNDGTESCTFFSCLNHILAEGGERQNCLHFCAKYNLPKMCKRILDRRYRSEMRDARDVNGKTPLDIAKDMGFDGVKRILQPEIRPIPLPTHQNDDTYGLTSLKSPIGNATFTDEPDSKPPQHRLRKASSTDEPSPTLTRPRKTSSASRGEAMKPETTSLDGKHTAGLQRASSTETMPIPPPRRRTLSRSGAVLRTSRDDSGNESAGSRDTGSSNGSVQRRESKGRLGLASNGEANTETMLIENLSASGKANQFQSYQRREREYAGVGDLDNQRQQHEVRLRPERSERPYNQPWEQDRLPNGMPEPEPEPERVVTSL